MKCGFASIGRANAVCLARCAAAEKFNIKKIMTNYYNNVHDSRDTLARLTRQTTSAFSIHINDIVELMKQVSFITHNF